MRELLGLVFFSPVLRWLLWMIPMTSCGLTIRVVTTPRADQPTWHLTVVQQGSPIIWPLNAHWNPLGGMPADTRTTYSEVPFVDGVATAVCPRRSGLFETYSCQFGPHRDNDTRVVCGESKVVVAPFATAKRERRGDTLIVSGLDVLTRDVTFDEVKDVSTLELRLDERSVEAVEVSQSFQRNGWAWDGNRWHSRSGLTWSDGLTCQPGHEVELPLSALHRARWRLWTLEGTQDGSGAVERAQWPKWRETKSPVLVTEGTGHTATFTCPEQPGTLALETDGSHPELLFVQLFGLNRG